jgi:sterol desaturase/sphingolipid hydroxylase (fatty acid hydroxylase superfamily)
VSATRESGEGGAAADASATGTRPLAPGEYTPLAAFMHPEMRVVSILFGGGAAVLIAVAAAIAPADRWWTLPLAVVYGALWWSFIEYVFHRWVLHWEPETPRLRRVRKFLPGHRSHHDDPLDPDDVVNVKHAPGLLLLPLILAAMVLIGFPLGFAFAALAGGMAGYWGYEYVHFACHQLPMRSWLGRRLKQHHAIHHHRDETVNFGVTSPLWDIVFGTRFRPARTAARRSAA